MLIPIRTKIDWRPTRCGSVVGCARPGRQGQGREGRCLQRYFDTRIGEWRTMVFKPVGNLSRWKITGKHETDHTDVVPGVWETKWSASASRWSVDKKRDCTPSWCCLTLLGCDTTTSSSLLVCSNGLSIIAIVWFPLLIPLLVSLSLSPSLLIISLYSEYSLHPPNSDLPES